MSIFSSKNQFFKLIRASVAAFFLLSSLPIGAQAQSIAVSGMVAPGTLMSLSAPFQGPALMGIQAYPQDPLKFSFIFDQGVEALEPDQLNASFGKAVRYFLAGLAIPEEDLWVNLSPYEKDRIVPDALGHTDAGQDMLKQDYILKQLSASLTYPDSESGKKFWDKVYKKIKEQLGVQEIPEGIFSKVWIVPEHSVVYETNNRAVIAETHLKVMLEADYLAWKNNTSLSDLPAEDGVSQEVMREVVVPLLEEEVNQGTYFMPLRQIYHALILASWFKDQLKMNAVAQVYGNKKKIVGIEAVSEGDAVQAIYNQYLEAFRKGAYNYIKEDVVGDAGEIVARQYFSGGTRFSNVSESREDRAVSSEQFPAVVSRIVAGQNPVQADVRLSPIRNKQSSNAAILGQAKDPVLGTATAVTIRKDAFDLKRIEIMGRLMGLDYLVEMLDQLYEQESVWRRALDRLRRENHTVRGAIRALISALHRDCEILRAFNSENFTFDLFEQFPPESPIGKLYSHMKSLPSENPQKAELQKTLREIVQHPAGVEHFSVLVAEEERAWLKQEKVDGVTVYDLLQAVIQNPQVLPYIHGFSEEEFQKIVASQRAKFEQTFDLIYQPLKENLEHAKDGEERAVLEVYVAMLDDVKRQVLAKAKKAGNENFSLNGYLSAFTAAFSDFLKGFEGVEPSMLDPGIQKLVSTFSEGLDISLTMYREGLLRWHWHTSQLRSIIARDAQAEIARAKAKTAEYITASDKYWRGLPPGTRLRATADIAYQFVSKVRDALENMSTTSNQGVKDTTHSYRWIIMQAIDETLKMKNPDEQKLYRPLLQEIAHSIIKTAEIELSAVDRDQPVDLFIRDFLTPSGYRELYNHFEGQLRNIIITKGSLTSHYVFLAAADGVGVIIVDSKDLPKDISDGQEISVSVDEQGKTFVDVLDLMVGSGETGGTDILAKGNMSKAFGGDPGSYVTANADTEKEAQKADQNSARGLGLVRSENQLEDADIPSRGLYRERWRAMARALSGRPLTIRAFDWKDDKKTTMLAHITFAGAKMYLDDEMGREILKEQLRALIDLRNQGYENIRFMFPMVETMEDIRAIRQIIAEVLAEEEFADLKGKLPIELGSMIETPKALMNLGVFLQEKDISFFSIGTNDLISALYGVNRSDPEANKYFDLIYPRILNEVVSVVRQASSVDGGKKVTICGELASKQRFWIVRSILRDRGIHFGLSMPSNDIPVFNGVMEMLRMKSIRALPEFRALEQKLGEISSSVDPGSLDDKYLESMSAELRVVNTAVEEALRKRVAAKLGLELSKTQAEKGTNSSVILPEEAKAGDKYGGVDFTGYRTTTTVYHQDDPLMVEGPPSQGGGIMTLGGDGFAGFSFDILTIVPYLPSMN